MSVDVRTVGAEEYGAALDPIWHYFGRRSSEEDAERMLRILPAERLHAAFDDGAVVGAAGAYHFELTVPGGSVPAAGVVAVGVLPTHRRRGILTELMRKQLGDAREWGDALALLYASEGAIYRRFGYGPASISGEIAVPRAHSSFYGVPASAGRVRMVEQDEALELFPPVYDRVCAETPGMFARTREWWEVRRFHRPPWAKSERVYVLLETDGRPEGYAIYSIEFEMEHGASRSVAHVAEAIGATPAATRDIWRFLLDLDWMETIKASFLPPDHPLFLLLTEPRRMRYVAAEALWARLVDVGAALSARTFAGDGEIVLEVADEFCPWNEGRWRVTAGGAERTEGGADLRLGVDALGSVYLGGFTFADLARAGRVEDLRDGAVARADALFWTDRHPWCPEIF
jgi:predicted acetyltransferase